MDLRTITSKLCTLCKKEKISITSIVCCKCNDELLLMQSLQTRRRDGSWPQNLHGIYSLWPYEPLIRRLILSIKIHNHYPMLRFLVKLLQLNPQMSALITSHKWLTAARSSLWGRLHGKFDIAGYTAWTMASYHQRRLLSLPSLGWHMRKRAALKKGTNAPVSFKDVGFINTLSGIPDAQLLIFDDIVATGMTINSMVQSLPQFQIAVLTLADSKRLGP